MCQDSRPSHIKREINLLESIQKLENITKMTPSCLFFGIGPAINNICRAMGRQMTSVFHKITFCNGKNHLLNLIGGRGIINEHVRMHDFR